VFENIFETVNSGFAQAMYEDYLRDPSSVSEEWRKLFDSGVKGEKPETETLESPGEPERPATTPATTSDQPDTSAAAGAPIAGPALRLLKNMEASLDIPTATSFRDVDVGRLWAVRAGFNRQLAERGIKLSFTHFIGWAIVRAAGEFPSMVHAVLEQGEDRFRVEPEHVNLGLAVDTTGKQGERKLMVPVIKTADTLDFDQFYAEYERLVAGARDGKLLPDAYMGASITLTNPGTIGTVASVPRLMKGHGSIIATGAIRTVAGTRVMTLTSTYDHRIIQGAESGLFLQSVDALLQGEHEFYEQIGEALQLGDIALESAIGAAMAATSAAAAPSAEAGAVPSHELFYHVAAGMTVVRNHRTHGYLAAQLDPLGRPPRGDPALEPATLGLTPDIMRQIPADVLQTYVGGETLADVLPRLRETYCGTIAYEIEHIADHTQRVWLRRVIESGEHVQGFRDDARLRLLKELTKVDTLERFLQRQYPGHKRFGIEGLDIIVPMVHMALARAVEQGAHEAVLGMAHRGRLNVLTHILGFPYETLLAEFEGGREVEETLTPVGGTGDVKYHHGLAGTFVTNRGFNVGVALLPNPSHLEAVNPVVEGNTRARQSDRTTRELRHDPNVVLPILIHGDAAFPGQGVVSETLNLARLDGYTTGGTLHVIANNQIGFTTPQREASSTDFASDLAKGFDIPIVHVNADDPEACLSAVRLALMYREKFHGDVVINLVGYRRHGHNEGDEPRFTQPMLYQLIDEHPTVRELYAQRLVQQGIVAEDEAERMAQELYDTLIETQTKLRADLEGQTADGEEPRRITGEYVALGEPETAVDAAVLQELNDELFRIPDGFAINRKLKRVIDRQHQAFAEGTPIDWAHAETLAYASLLVEGVPVRLTGQDTARGTFSQRHLTWFDGNTGDPWTPLQNLSRAAVSLELHNSPLSEYAAMGFEYGYSVAAREALVLWEAQFGDFANGAEIIIDQFIIAGLAKWGQETRLTLLLPHGYEGQGPEHSSARLERYLALGAEGNIRVANCSTPAQYFHLLRRQAKHVEVRPLIVMTPKSLLRLPQATSLPAELTSGTFRPVLDDPAPAGPREGVTRLVLCSGKVYYEVAGSDRRADAAHVAVARLELLYPFPGAKVVALIESYPNLQEIVWLQEEPMNMGARKWVIPALTAVLPTPLALRYVSRPERSSPAEGYPAAHRAEQLRLVSEALQ